MSDDDGYDGDLKAMRQSVREGALALRTGTMRATDGCHYVWRMIKQAMVSESLKATYPDRKTMKAWLPEPVRGMLDQESARVMEQLRELTGTYSRVGGRAAYSTGKEIPADLEEILDKLLLDAADRSFRLTCEILEKSGR
jgi:hypothetical protein